MGSVDDEYVGDILRPVLCSYKYRNMSMLFAIMLAFTFSKLPAILFSVSFAIPFAISFTILFAMYIRIVFLNLCPLIG